MAVPAKLQASRRQPAYSAVGLDASRWPRLQKRYVIIIAVLVLICIGAGVIHLCFYLQSSKHVLTPPDPEVALPPSPSTERVFARAAVCSDGAPCSTIGRDILARNGSAVDAAVATLLCNGVVNCHSMGLGGGFFMTFYSRSERKAYALNARETAPGRATPDMYKSNRPAAKLGALAVGVPGELKGYWEAHQRFGRLPWAEVVAPAVHICKQGYNMTKHQADALGTREVVRDDPILKEVFVDPETGEMRKMGSPIHHTKLCETLQVIAERGGDDLYLGTLAKELAQDVQKLGGLITEQDLSNYRAKWSEPVTAKLRGDNILYSVPPPGSGALLAFILNVLDGYNFTAASVDTVENMVLTYHRIVEAYKHAFARRTELGDTEFVDIAELLGNLSSADYAASVRRLIRDNATSQDPDEYGAVSFQQDDHGTAHVSVIAPDGDAVSITSTINLYFGAAITSPQTGIILNSVMDDFSSPEFKNHFGLPGSPNNVIMPGKRPLSSMCPAIIVGADDNVRMVVGASGGTKISTAVAYVIMRHLWFGESIKEAVDASRFHHQLFPMEISYEFGTLDQVVKGLRKLGHKLKRYRDRGSIICGVTKQGDKIIANADYRKGGEVDGM